MASTEGGSGGLLYVKFFVGWAILGLDGVLGTTGIFSWFWAREIVFLSMDLRILDDDIDREWENFLLPEEPMSSPFACCAKALSSCTHSFAVNRDFQKHTFS